MDARRPLRSSHQDTAMWTLRATGHRNPSAGQHGLEAASEFILDEEPLCPLPVAGGQDPALGRTLSTLAPERSIPERVLRGDIASRQGKAIVPHQRSWICPRAHSDCWRRPLEKGPGLGLLQEPGVQGEWVSSQRASGEGPGNRVPKQAGCSLGGRRRPRAWCRAGCMAPGKQGSRHSPSCNQA